MDLLQETKRVGELKKSINSISQKLLISNLKDMEKDNLLVRKAFTEILPHVEYTLHIGYNLKPLLDIITQ